MSLNRLKATEVAKMAKPGRYADGGGLYLQVSPGGSKQWLLRYMLDGTARQMGLGGFPTFNLAEARERARLWRQQVKDGVDAIEARREERSEARAQALKQITFKEAAGKATRRLATRVEKRKASAAVDRNAGDICVSGYRKSVGCGDRHRACRESPVSDLDREARNSPPRPPTD